MGVCYIISIEYPNNFTYYIRISVPSILKIHYLFICTKLIWCTIKFTWKWTSLAKLGSLMKVSCRYEQISLTSRTWLSAWESPASKRIWTAALSWAVVRAFFNSSLSKSFVTCDDDDLSMIGFSWRCCVNMVLEAAKQALRMYKSISKRGAHSKTRRSHLRKKEYK